MPACSCCSAIKTLLDHKDVCRECRNHDTNTPESNSIATDEYSNIPALPNDWMSRPLNELLDGQVMLLISNNVKPIKDALDEQKGLVKILEDSYRTLLESQKALDKEKEKLKQRDKNYKLRKE